ncbi:DUF5815 family protein [Salarchaeum japonicum]|uniref:DUF5815 family protein n=1 Tax=Salarchaeum japonicum TaxID=555573 RepID=UPI001D0A96AC|nr:DUF5815 family protein [Salarchaeum japonicum]
MAEPRVPDDDGGDGGGGGASDGVVELPCGERVETTAFDLGMREYDCPCGESHAVVMDMHPPGRFLPESIVDILESAVEPAEDDAFEEFGTPHLMGAVMEDVPEEVATYDASGEGEVGYALLWVFDFDSRTLHEYVVELVVELMDHAVSHAENPGAQGEFEDAMTEFDVGAFVEEYRDERNWEA